MFGKLTYVVIIAAAGWFLSGLPLETRMMLLADLDQAGTLIADIATRLDR